MAWLDAVDLTQFLVFTLVLSRVSGLLMTAPVYGVPEVPLQVRALLAVALALVLAPTQLSVAVPLPDGVPDYLLLVGAELLVGVALGLGVQVLFLAVQLAGQLISQTSGVALADVFNPSLDSEVSLFSQLLYLFALAIFLTIGGHRLVMAGLLETFQSIPPGRAHVPAKLDTVFALLVTESLQLGLRMAAPAVTAVLVATLVMGLISRTVPQLNIMVVGFGINALATLAALSLSLGVIAWAFEAELEPFLETLFSLATG